MFWIGVHDMLVTGVAATCPQVFCQDVRAANTTAIYAVFGLFAWVALSD